LRFEIESTYGPQEMGVRIRNTGHIHYCIHGDMYDFVNSIAAEGMKLGEDVSPTCSA
jgi:hypothetical protein